MGDRIRFIFADAPLAEKPVVTVLYSHWGGASRHEDLAHAIAKALPRWNDPSYATRICVSQIVGDGWQSETGFGLFASTSDEITGMWDDRDPILVNWHDQTVTIPETSEQVTLDAYVVRFCSGETLEQYRSSTGVDA